ncbi:MAG: type 1 glutamine amidotransferase [Ghiorsea sp.]
MANFKVHYLQHVGFEGLSSIEPYLLGKGHTITSTKQYLGETLPSVDDFDWLIVMGGPMGIYDHEKYPWLVAEKVLIKQAIEAGKTVLGICLGAQMIADVMGAKVYQGKHKETGWFDIQRSSEIENTVLNGVFSEQFNAFHWHGDTFSIPEGAQALGSSEACKHQGFIFDNRVVALQFHLETTPDSAAALIENCGDELDGSRYVQSAKVMVADEKRFSALNKMMFRLLDKMEKGT